MVSHTASGEWQSFEVRMRRRRADRLVLRAEAAIEAGCLEEARECLTEARTLAPALPALDTLQRRLSEPVLATPELVGLPEPEPASKSRRVAIAAAVLAISAAAAAGATMMVARTGTTPTGTTVESVAEAPRTSVSSGSPVSTAAATPAEPGSSTPADVFAAETAAALPVAAPDVKPDIPQKLLDAAVPPVTLPIQPTDSMALQRASLETIPVPPAPSVLRTPEPEPTPIAEVRLPAAPIAAPVLPTPPASEPSHEPAVRAVLDRYAAAYSSLDVNAAQRVWPSVNRGALARAFDSLVSQQVSLGDCRIDVSGLNATARCSGTTSWTPKVGDGAEHNEARGWTFELARGAAGWEIVTARVQKR